ncbi:hypothetical protein FI667_g16039, partial [Globisporangium splendens]
MASKPRFPLPKGYFGPVHLTPDEQNHYRQIARERLDAVLQHEHEFTQVQQRQVDPAKWRLVKSKHQLRIYRRRKNSLTLDDNDESRKPSMLGIGKMEGTLDDVLYGSYDKSHEEVQLTTNFVDASIKDCTVLHNIDLATPQDPYHYLGIKWFITQLPASFIIYPRDWCNLEALGVEYDTQGRRFGYFIINSIELKNCPPFDPRVLVRGRTRLSFIYREPVPGIVEVFAHGLFDPAGELIQRFTTTMTSEVLAGIFRVVECAEAKKLTLLALKNHKGKYAADTLLEYCSLCRSTGSLFSSLNACRVCGTTVCSQCRVRKPIFIGPAHAVRKVPCCRSCIKQAKFMEIRPAEPSCSILGEEHLPEDQFFQSGEFGGSSDDSNSEPTPSGAYHDIDTDGLSELDEDEYRFSNESGILEADIEQIIESMMRQKRDDSSASSSAGEASGESQDQTSSLHGLPPDQVAIFEQILGLQTAAHKAHAITQANNEMMKKLT